MVTRSTGRPLVLIPGLLCDALLWAPQIAGLGSRADCWVADHRRSATMSAIASDVLADAPFERFALAGLSMGGYVALEIMRQAPARVSHLALLDTSARADTDEQRARRGELIALSERGRFIGVSKLLLPQLLHADHLRDSGLVAIVKAMARNIGREAFIRQERAILSRPDSRPMLATIDRPTLVLCGREDILTPIERSQEIADGIRGAQFDVVGDCGHLSTLEQPASVNEALRNWLERS